MANDPGGKRLMARLLKGEAIVKAEKGQLADAMELLDKSAQWKSRARHDAKAKKGKKS